MEQRPETSRSAPRGWLNPRSRLTPRGSNTPRDPRYAHVDRKPFRSRYKKEWDLPYPRAEVDFDSQKHTSMENNEESDVGRQTEKTKEEYEDTDSGEPSGGDGARLDDEELARTKSSVAIAETMSLPREILFVSVVCLAQFMTQASLGGTLAIIHIIGDSFGISDPSELSWLIAGYSLTVGTFILVAGRFGDLFGPKRMFIIGFAWFGLWSMIAGVSVYSNSVLFTFARVFQGIGPAICMPNAIALLGRAYNPGPRKAAAFAAFGGCAPGGAITGAAMASVFALAWWPWAFWSFAITCACIAVVAWLVIPNTPGSLQGRLSLMEYVHELDLLGGTVGVTSLVLFNFAWNQAPIVGWHEAYVCVTLVLGVLLAPVFFYIELRVAKQPLIPFDALTVDTLFVLVCIACGWGCFGVFVYYTWQFLEILRHASPLLVSAYFSPAAVIGFLASGSTAYLLGHTRPALVMVLAMMAFTVGIIVIGTAPVDQTYWSQTFVCLLIIPFGMDMSFPAGTLILSNSVAKKAQGIAASLVATVVNYSISLGLGFAGTVEVHIDGPGETPEQVLTGFRGAFYVGIGLASLGLIVSLVFLAKSYFMDEQSNGKEEQ